MRVEPDLDRLLDRLLGVGLAALPALRTLVLIAHSRIEPRHFGDVVSPYENFQKIRELSESRDDEARMAELPRLVSSYYDAVTRFYEFGWGTSFHFSPRQPGESLHESHRRHEVGIGELLGLKPGMQVVDLGCGVAGPMMTIAKASGANITGINISSYQIGRGQRLLSSAGLDDQCGFLLADFMDIPIEDEALDAIYSFEALCHAPDNLLLFLELYRLLKPGGEIAIVDWCWTDRFDRNNARHNELRERLEFINATLDLLTTSEKAAAAQAAGFEIIQAIDQQAENGNRDTPWYMALQGRDLSFASWARTPKGRQLTAAVTRFLELVRLAPQGASEAAAVLNVAADTLVEAGELEIFTPSFLVHARKPVVGLEASY
ncbi:MAG: methyltransferase domain-containing protein [Chloroflexota bacterium]|nr:methyltransferase domain-containing protein [Chloroflexota bacterium]